MPHEYNTAQTRVPPPQQQQGASCPRTQALQPTQHHCQTRDSKTQALANNTTMHMDTALSSTRPHALKHTHALKRSDTKT